MFGCINNPVVSILNSVVEATSRKNEMMSNKQIDGFKQKNAAWVTKTLICPDEEADWLAIALIHVPRHRHHGAQSCSSNGHIVPHTQQTHSPGSGRSGMGRQMRRQVLSSALNSAETERVYKIF